MHVVLTGSSEWMNYIYTLGLGSTKIFQKPYGQLRKTMDEKRNIKEVHNLNYRHCLAVVAHIISKYRDYVCHLMQSYKQLSSLGTLEMVIPPLFWRLYTLESKTVIMETNMTF